METRRITEETAMQIENAISACEEAAALAFVLQGSLLDTSGSPSKELIANAAAGIGRAVQRIGSDLESTLMQIYKGEPEGSSGPATDAI